MDIDGDSVCGFTDVIGKHYDGYRISIATYVESCNLQQLGYFQINTCMCIPGMNRNKSAK